MDIILKRDVSMGLLERSAPDRKSKAIIITCSQNQEVAQVEDGIRKLLHETWPPPWRSQRLSSAQSASDWLGIKLHLFLEVSTLWPWAMVSPSVGTLSISSSDFSTWWGHRGWLVRSSRHDLFQQALCGQRDPRPPVASSKISNSAFPWDCAQSARAKLFPLRQTGVLGQSICPPSQHFPSLFSSVCP